MSWRPLSRKTKPRLPLSMRSRQTCTERMNSMTKKELSQLYYLNREIEEQQRRLAELEDAATSCTTHIRDRQDSNAADRANNVADGESTGRNGTAQSNRPDEMGWDDEQHQALSGGNSAQRADLQLEYYSRETEDKSLPFFHSDKYINDILKTTPHLNATKQEITNFYATHLDDEEREKYIKGIFNNDYTEITIDGDTVLVIRPIKMCFTYGKAVTIPEFHKAIMIGQLLQIILKV